MVPKQRQRFYDGGDPGGPGGVGAQPADPDRDIKVELDRILKLVDAKPTELFLLRRRIAYNDRHCGEIIVPPDYEQFESDLTSVPALFTWLVPKTGSHLPAALIHDGLVGDLQAPTYISTEHKIIDRVEADRIFRDGMADTGTGLVRRWLVWTAVTLATMWAREGTAGSSLVRSYYRWIMAASVGSVAWLGYVCTADLFDRTDRWWLTYEVWWMGDRPFWQELITGLAGAIVIPVAFGLLWGKFRRAGWIAGIAVGVLFHITIGLLAVSALYAALESVVAKLPGLVLRWIGAAVVLAAAAVFVAAST